MRGEVGSAKLSPGVTRPAKVLLVLAVLLGVQAFHTERRGDIASADGPTATVGTGAKVRIESIAGQATGQAPVQAQVVGQGQATALTQAQTAAWSPAAVQADARGQDQIGQGHQAVAADRPAQGQIQGQAGTQAAIASCPPGNAVAGATCNAPNSGSSLSNQASGQAAVRSGGGVSCSEFEATRGTTAEVCGRAGAAGTLSGSSRLPACASAGNAMNANPHDCAPQAGASAAVQAATPPAQAGRRPR